MTVLGTFNKTSTYIAELLTRSHKLVVMQSVCLMFSLMIHLTDSIPKEIVHSIIHKLDESIEWIHKGQTESISKENAIYRLKQIIQDIEDGRVESHHTSQRKKNGYGIVELVDDKLSYRITYFSETNAALDLRVQKVKVVRRVLE